MKIVRVIAIAKGAPKGELSYFSKIPVQVGSIVSIPVRKKEYPALVVSISEAGVDRSLIRSSDFALKKISTILREDFFSKKFIESCEKTAEYYVSSVGQVLNTFTSGVILKNLQKINFSNAKILDNKRKPQSFVLGGEKKERILKYKSLIRERFAKGESLIFVFPTIADTDFFYNSLRKGIEQYSFSFHSRKTERKLIADWNLAISEKHPIALFVTAKFLSIPRCDCGVIVIENENSPLYKLESKPYPDVRKFVEFFASLIGADILFADQILSIDNYYLYKTETILPYSQIETRLNLKAQTQIVDMRKKEDERIKKFTIFSPKLIKLIETTRDTSSQMILYCAKKGIASQTVCNDCGDVLKCAKCFTPNILKSQEGASIFICPRCGEKSSAEVRCKRCNSWKLSPIGVGTERVVTELKEKFEKLKIFRLDADNVKNTKEAIRVCTEFLETAGAVLVGTDMIFQFINESVSNTAIVSLDSLFSIPDFKINERIFSNILKMRFLTKENTLIQTRNPENAILKMAVEGRIGVFYEHELSSRRKFSYPPFGVFVKIGMVGNQKDAEIFFGGLSKILQMEISGIQSATELTRGKSIFYGLIKLKKDVWPDAKLKSILETLPMNIKVDVEPTSLL